MVDNIKDLLNEKDIFIKEIKKQIRDINKSNNHKFSSIEDTIKELGKKDNKINEKNNKIIEQEREIKKYKEKEDSLNIQFEEIPIEQEIKNEKILFSPKIKREEI